MLAFLLGASLGACLGVLAMGVLRGLAPRNGPAGREGVLAGRRIRSRRRNRRLHTRVVL